MPSRNIKKETVTGNDVKSLLISINRALSKVYREMNNLKAQLEIKRGNPGTLDSDVGTIRLVEEKKGSNKYRVEAKFKDGVKVLDAEFKDRRKGG